MSAETPAPIAAERLGVLAVADRNGLDESLHLGAGVALDVDGSVIASVGDPAIDIYPRSSLKPFQAAAMVANGLDLPDRLLALAAASHMGEQRHLDGVVEILTMHGLSVDDLRNTPSRPAGAASRAQARLAGTEPSSLQQNCSGKHAAMLATCVVNGWSTADYLEPAHPLQLAIISELETLGAKVAHVGVDGCGAPTHVIGLDETARAMGRLARSGSSVTRAMSSFPLMVGGTDRDVSIWMDAVPGLAAKDGAQGVMVMASAEGRSAAFKIADGADSARQAVTAEAMRHLGVDVDGEHADVRDRLAVTVLGHGDVVGSIRALPWTVARS